MPRVHDTGERVGRIVFGEPAEPTPGDTLDRFPHVPPGRRDAIEVGEAGRRTVRATVYAYELATASTRAVRCTPDDGACVCTGIEDCNDLFAGKCRRRSSGGACVGKTPVCVCTPGQATEQHQGDPPERVAQSQPGSLP